MCSRASTCQSIEFKLDFVFRTLERHTRSQLQSQVRRAQGAAFCLAIRQRLTRRNLEGLGWKPASRGHVHCLTFQKIVKQS